MCCNHQCTNHAPPRPTTATHPAPHSTRVQQTLCANALVHHDDTAWLPHPAPAPEEVLWSNLRFRKWERAARRALIMAAYVALLLFMMIPIALLQGLISAVGNVSWLSFMYTISPLNAIMTSVIPTLALKIFIIILPPLLKLMTRLEGVTSVTEVDLGMETKYYGYLVCSCGGVVVVCCGVCGVLSVSVVHCERVCCHCKRVCCQCQLDLCLALCTPTPAPHPPPRSMSRSSSAPSSAAPCSARSVT